MKLKKKTKILLIIVTVIVVLLLAWLLISVPSLIAPVLWTLLLLGIGFFALEYWSRAKKKKKQRAFDEKVSAKEGIEDRKREWQGWVDELEKQGIDRYELPFYLVVGEPQSGKSVLLQNSDLYFPFGQERLSGVGGTRGCDWWFTDEAVILDIAGRLFTHEGGVADKMEWESFLDQLNQFRPMSPANGVLLVIPCDALLEDSPELCAEKANKIQSALLTLTQKLEAQLPIYLVLTKGDRIFGFAESVHRMDSEQRHQMFGWSRESEKAEQPFGLEEAKAGYSRLVDRARLLRERMISSARLPEALPEIDRLYAFPDELEGMYPSLEIYLKRIFTESNLVERASFRGIYLTSGLQTGAPIAKVCAELLGDDRESDARALEGLFSHQRAYFIKDLVRKRVFAERGLVRPTEGRVSSARRKAVMGFGAAGLLALVAVVGAVQHAWTGHGVDVKATLESAIKAADNAADSTDVVALLGYLGKLDKGVKLPRSLIEEVFGSTRADLEDLYLNICKTRLVPALRRQLQQDVLDKVGAPRSEANGSKANEPKDSVEAEKWIAAVNLLCADLRFDSEEGLRLVDDFLSDFVGAYSVRDAVEGRGGSAWLSSVPDVGKRPRLDRLAKRAQELLNGLIDPSNDWMIGGHLGYMAAWVGAEAAKVSFDNREGDLLEHCDVFANAVAKLSEATGDDGKIAWYHFMTEVSEQQDAWKPLLKFREPNRQDDELLWPSMNTLLVAADLKFKQNEGNAEFSPPTLATGLLGRISNMFAAKLQAGVTAAFKVKMNPVQQWIDGDDYDDCRVAPHADWTLSSISGKLTVEGKPRPDVLYADKVKALAAGLLKIGDWKAARESFHAVLADAPKEGELDAGLVDALSAISSELSLYELPRRSSAQKGHERISVLLDLHLKAVDSVWAKQNPQDGAEIDWINVGSLARLAGNKSVRSDVKRYAGRLMWRYLNLRQEGLLRIWKNADEHSSETLVIIEKLKEHLDELLKEPVEADQAHSDWLADVNTYLLARLEAHKSELQNHWTPNSELWSGLSLQDFLEQAGNAFGGAAVGKLIKGDESARDRKQRAEDGGVDWPSTRASALYESDTMSGVVELDATNAAIAYLRSARAASKSDVARHKLAKATRTVIGQILDAVTPDDALLATLAARMKAMTVKAAKDAKADPLDIYVQGVQKAVSDRLVLEVRARYLVALKSELKRSGLVEALYAGGDDLSEINADNEGSVIPALSNLLNPSKKLFVLRSAYKMEALQPGEITAQLEDADWWQFEKFLVALQAFLHAEKATKVENVSFQVRMEPVGKLGAWAGVWDLPKNGKFDCHFSTSSMDDAGQKVSYSADRKLAGWEKMKESPLDWGFGDGTGRPPTLWFTWTTDSAYTRDKDDPNNSNQTFELTGSLAPLLWCWSGEQDSDGWWQVAAEPENAAGRIADLRLQLEREKTVVKLPMRPKNKPSF